MFLKKKSYKQQALDQKGARGRSKNYVDKLDAKGRYAKAKADAKSKVLKAKGEKKSLAERSLRTKYRAAALASAVASKFDAEKASAKQQSAAEIAKWNSINSMNPSPATGTKEPDGGKSEEESEENPYSPSY